jgi:predicted DNA-binding protein (MmcQ/YjbR family)
MELQALTAFCRAQPGAVPERPFGPQPLVFKVAGRVFALVEETGDPPRVSLKCDPEIAVALRAAHAAVVPGYHLNKRHWNTVALDGTVPPEDVCAWVEDSYDLVVAGLPRRLREALPGGTHPAFPDRQEDP